MVYLVQDNNCYSKQLVQFSVHIMNGNVYNAYIKNLRQYELLGTTTLY